MDNIWNVFEVVSFKVKWNEIFIDKQLIFFSPTLYVGEYEHGFFATNSLVDETTVTVAVSTYYLFIPEVCVQKIFFL